MATWDDVANIVAELQLTDEPSPHEWRVGKKLIAWERPLRKPDREALTESGHQDRPRATSSVCGLPTRASSSR